MKCPPILFLLLHSRTLSYLIPHFSSTHSTSAMVLTRLPVKFYALLEPQAHGQVLALLLLDLVSAALDTTDHSLLKQSSLSFSEIVSPQIFFHFYGSPFSTRPLLFSSPPTHSKVMPSSFWLQTAKYMLMNDFKVITLSSNFLLGFRPSASQHHQLLT